MTEVNVQPMPDGLMVNSRALQSRIAGKLRGAFGVYALVSTVVGAVALLAIFIEPFRLGYLSFGGNNVLVAVTCFAVALLAALVANKRSPLATMLVKAIENNSEVEFMIQWLRFEELARNELLSRGEVFNAMSIRDILSHLVLGNLISADEEITIRELLRFRNSLVHDGARPSEHTVEHMQGRLLRVCDRFGADDMPPKHSSTIADG